MAHIVPVRTYYQVFAALIALLAVTVVAGEIENELINALTAVTIAMTKAVLIVLFFMHVKYSSRLTQVLAIAGFVWLAILIVLTLADYTSRMWPLVSMVLDS